MWSSCGDSSSPWCSPKVIVSHLCWCHYHEFCHSVQTCFLWHYLCCVEMCQQIDMDGATCEELPDSTQPFNWPQAVFRVFPHCFIVCCFYLLDLIALELCNSLGRCRHFKLFCVCPLLFPSIPVSSDWAQINLRGLQAVVLFIFRAGGFSGDLEEATFMFGYSVRTLDYSYVFVFVLSHACNLEKENAGL